ncbi:hypothetical protein [uncultured Bacteroides sp.]|uniref:hypothetical protein n=1 Tax=uncultured Bacteroides sp. TaxID=162156 RepID=UPI002AAB585E|nr:hypothetical protein [uncultured Bacteroides sp.]
MKRDSYKKYDKFLLRASEIVRYIREEDLKLEKITQTDVADEACLSVRTIMRMENKESLSWNTINKVFQVYAQHKDIYSRYASLIIPLARTEQLVDLKMYLSAGEDISSLYPAHCYVIFEEAEEAYELNYRNL